METNGTLQPASPATRFSPPAIVGQSLRGIRRCRGMLFGIIILALMGTLSLGAPFLTDADPRATNPLAISQPPGTTGHLLGTDALGRDVLARTLVGARVSLSIGLAAGTLSIILGTLVGALAGFGPTWLDGLLMRLVDLMLALPMLVLVIAISSLVRPSPIMVVLVIALLGWISVARVVRAQFFVLREAEFVVAAHALGAPRSRIAFRYILPNALAPILAIASFVIAGAILTEATLSYLGLGVPEATPTWGTMLAAGQSTLLLGQWWTVVIPAAAITLTVIAVNAIADDIRFHLHDRTRGHG